MTCPLEQGTHTVWTCSVVVTLESIHTRVCVYRLLRSNVLCKRKGTSGVGSGPGWLSAPPFITQSWNNPGGWEQVGGWHMHRGAAFSAWYAEQQVMGCQVQVTRKCLWTGSSMCAAGRGSCTCSDKGLLRQPAVTSGSPQLCLWNAGTNGCMQVCCHGCLSGCGLVV